jgi:hypothetical protein
LNNNITELQAQQQHDMENEIACNFKNGGEKKRFLLSGSPLPLQLYAYFKFRTNTSYHRVVKENTNKEIEELLDGFRKFQKSVKHLADTTIVAEANQAGTFLYYIYRQSPENFNVSNINAF